MEYAKNLSNLYTEIKREGEKSMLAQAVRNNFKEFELIDKIELEESDIIENPNEVVVQFPIVSDIQLEEKLPFFKSIMVKFASL